MSVFTVRPSNSNSEKETFRVRLTATSLLSLKLNINDIVLLQLPNDEGGPPRPAIAWDNSGTGMKDNIVQTSKTLQELYGFKLGDKIGLVRSSEILEDASIVKVRPFSATLTDDDKVFWPLAMSKIVHRTHHALAPSQKLSVELVGGEKEEFEVIDVGGKTIGRITQATKFVLVDSSRPSSSHGGTKIQLETRGIGGLGQQLDQIQRKIDDLLSPDIEKYFPGYEHDQGLLLYGSGGVGKSLVIKAISKSGWSSIVKWSPDIKPQATVKRPTLILVDLSIVSKNARSISSLQDLFESIRGTPTLVVGETQHLNDVDNRLRSFSTFSTEIELPVPDVDQRLDILRVCRGPGQQPSDEQIKDLASYTHGFVGADLKSLHRRILTNALHRCQDEAHHYQQQVQQPLTTKGLTNGTSTSDDNNGGVPLVVTITREDIEKTLPTVRPTALQQIFLEKPSVHWDDIGGQHALKHQLSAAVTRPHQLESRQRMSRLGLTPPKGVLLYGPPGCSKTLLVKALATEASLNFLAVKGAELISMYVGESERATREVFRKASAAAPCIVFFDEIDAIASRSRNGSAGGNTDLNVLTTLLNEMDGFEELRGVLVVAATNKPQSIDPALLRPGRFDNVVYVGLPDEQTRREIFQKRLAKVHCGEGVREGIEEYARRTGGMSGAEIVAVCQAAGELAMDDDRDAVEVADMETAVGRTPRGVTREMLEEYEKWNEARNM